MQQYINFDTVRNYYEALVFQYICSTYASDEITEQPGALEDIACLALNKLPARYVRFAVDTSFYLSTEKQQAMHAAVQSAVEAAYCFVKEHPKVHAE